MKPIEKINIVDIILPQKPKEGPPFPVLFNIRWPWRIGKPLSTWTSEEEYTAPKPVKFSFGPIEIYLFPAGGK